MFSKFIVFTVLAACMRSALAGFAAPVSYAAPTVYASAPVAYAAPVTKAVLAEPYAPANYDFGYSVSDPHTGDQKSQVESRRGDSVQGSYSLVDSDGTRRVVDYAADGINGFNAVVRKEPLAVAAPVIKTVAAAPVARIAAPVVAAYAAAPAHAHFAAAPALATYATAPAYAHFAAAPALSHYSAAPALSHYAAAPAFTHYAGAHALSYSSPLIAKYH